MNKYIKYIALLALSNNIRINNRIKLVRNNKLLTILNLHRTGDNDGSSYKPLDPKLFEKLLLFAKNVYTITTFSDLQNEIDHSSGKPLLIFSFDDGYKDFIDVAMPLLHKYKIKVNQNIIPECVETGFPPLNVIAQDYLGKAPIHLLRNLIIPECYIGNDFNDRIKLGLRVSKFLTNMPFDKQQQLREMLYEQFFDFLEFECTKMMNLAEVKECSELHELGAHSYSHASMEFETDGCFENDLLKCREFFDLKLGSSALIYAFPNGSYRENQLGVPFDFGYKHVLLVNDSFSMPNRKSHNRFGFYADSNNEVVFRTLGGLCEI